MVSSLPFRAAARLICYAAACCRPNGRPPPQSAVGRPSRPPVRCPAPVGRGPARPPLGLRPRALARWLGLRESGIFCGSLGRDLKTLPPSLAASSCCARSPAQTAGSFACCSLARALKPRARSLAADTFFLGSARAPARGAYALTPAHRVRRSFVFLLATATLDIAAPDPRATSSLPDTHHTTDLRV